MNLTLYSGFKKRENSTKIVAVGSGVSSYALTGVLKEPCSVEHPVIEIARLTSDASPADYTYAYISDFSRYYFVTDWVWNNGRWECHMTEDYLASWKTDIGNNQEYILRTNSTTSDFNGAISDTIYPATTDFNVVRTPIANNNFVSILRDGTYIVGIVSGDSANAVGAISYFAMDSNEFGDLKDALFSDENLETMEIIDGAGQLNIEDMSKELFRTMYNPYQYIASCMWFPISKSNIPGSVTGSIKIGWWDYSLSGKVITQQTWQCNDTPVLFPMHDDAATRGKYLNYAPYTSYTLYGKFGAVPLNTAMIEVGDYLITTYETDLITGISIVEIFASETSVGTNRKLLTRTQFQLGVPIQLAQIGVDYMGAAVSAVSATANTVGSIFSGNIGGAISSAANGIYNTINSSMPQLQTSGANGSFSNMEIISILITIHHVIADEDIEHKGRPLCEIRTINTLSGFVMCADGDIDIACFDSERKVIKNYLETGFFWE